jgi:hypothetical protein
VGAQQILQAGLVVVVVSEFEDRLLAELREPEDGAARHALVPGESLVGERADEPRRAVTGERAGGGGIEHEEGGGVFLQEGRGDVVVDLALGGGAHDVGLVLAPGHQDDAAGVHDRADAHRQRVAGRAGVAAEVAGGIAARERVERDQPRERVAGAARLVEADVAGATDAEDLEVDAAGGRDHRLVGGAVRVDLGLRHRARGQVGACGVDVHVVEEVGAHEAPVALRVVRRDRVIFVEVEGRDVGEAETRLAMEPHQLGIEADRRGAGGQAEDHTALLGLALPDQRGDLRGHRPGCFLTVRVDGQGDLLLMTAFEDGDGHGGKGRGERTE